MIRYWSLFAAASLGASGLFLAARAERLNPTNTSGGFLSPEIGLHELGMKAGYYFAVLGALAALVQTLWKDDSVLHRLLLAPIPAIAAALIVAFYWPPLTAEAYGDYPDDYPQRPLPFAPIDAPTILMAKRLAPERVAAAIASFQANGVQAAELRATLDRHGLLTDPPYLPAAGTPTLPHKTYLPFFVTNPMVNELYFVVYTDGVLASAQLEDARRSEYRCSGGSSSAFARHANVIAVVHTCRPGRPLKTGTEPAAAVLRDLGATSVEWLPPLAAGDGKGGLDEVTEQEKLYEDAEKAVEVVRQRLRIDIQHWNGDGRTVYLRPLEARAGTVSFEVVVSLDAATAQDLVEHNYLSAIFCPFNHPPPVLHGRVIVRAAELPGCRPPANRPALQQLAAEISRAIG